MATTSADESQVPSAEPPPGAPPAGLFMQAIYDDSNLEMDWLWLATKVNSNSQRRYALLRALRINPRSGPAKRGLAQLNQGRNQPLDLS